MAGAVGATRVQHPCKRHAAPTKTNRDRRCARARTHPALRLTRCPPATPPRWSWPAHGAARRGRGRCGGRAGGGAGGRGGGGQLAGGRIGGRAGSRAGTAGRVRRHGRPCPTHGSSHIPHHLAPPDPTPTQHINISHAPQLVVAKLQRGGQALAIHHHKAAAQQRAQALQVGGHGACAGGRRRRRQGGPGFRGRAQALELGGHGACAGVVAANGLVGLLWGQRAADTERPPSPPTLPASPLPPPPSSQAPPSPVSALRFKSSICSWLPPATAACARRSVGAGISGHEAIGGARPLAAGAAPA